MEWWLCMVKGVNKRKEDKKFLSIIKNIESKSSLYDGISNFKEDASYQEMYKYLQLLCSDPKYSKYITGCEFPKEYEHMNLFNGRYDRRFELKQELYWNVNILRLYSTEINNFISMKAIYEKNILLGAFDKAEEVLDRIETTFGKSLWLLENRISTLQQCRGLQVQKEYSEQIKNNEELDIFIRVVAYYSSIRVEENITHLKYNMYINEFLEDIKETVNDDYLIQYLGYRLKYFSDIDISDYSNVFLYESNSTIVDKYLTFIKVCQLMCGSKNALSEYGGLVRNAVELLSKNIRDQRIENLINIISPGSDMRFDSTSKLIIDAMDEYTLGNYFESTKKCSKIIMEVDPLIDVLEIYLRSSIRQNSFKPIGIEGSIINRICVSAYHLFSKDDKSNESFNEMMKYVYTYRDHSWTIKLYSFIKRVYSYDKIEKFYKEQIFEALYSYPNNPIQAVFFSNLQSRNRFYETLMNTYGDSKTVLLYSAIEKNDFNIIDKLCLPLDRYLKYKGQILRQNKKYIQAIDVYKELLKIANDIISKEDAVIGTIISLMESDQIEKCMDLVSDSYLDNKYIYTKIPFDELIKKIEKSSEPYLTGNISLSIVYDMYSKYIDSGKNYLKADAYEDLLNYYGLSKPSELGTCIDLFDKRKLIYFLDNVCIYNVMDNSTAFVGTEDIERERIQICHMLRQLDENDADKYINEATEIAQRLMIKKGIREIDKSKIYVDTDGIRKIVEENLKENYNRYLSLSVSNDKGDPFNYITIEWKEYSSIQFQMPTDQKLGLFYSMIFELRDKFVSNSQYGLDGNLSIGIRHGTISAWLRSPLETSHLITKKDNDTGNYRNNAFWTEKYKEYPEHIVSQILEYLNDFSREVDKLIDLLKNKWIQIRTEGRNEEGLFDFLLEVDELEELQSKVNVDTTYDQFVDLVFDKLWQMTDESLYNIRAHISGYFKEKFNESFFNLQYKLESLKDEIELKDIYAEINTSRISMQYHLDTLSSWFERSKGLNWSDFDISLPINIATELVKSMYPNVVFEPKIEINNIALFRGQAIKSFVHIFFILFDNVIKHSHINNGCSSIKIKIKINNSNGVLEISVENEISRDYDLLTGEKRLSIIRESLKNDGLIQNINKEGGTGFHKIKKMVLFDLKCDYNMEFLYTNNSTFYFKIKISTKEISL